MDYISVEQASQQWNITKRRVQELCKAGAILGVTRLGRAWLIPSDAQKPADGREKRGKRESFNEDLPHLPMPRKNPCLIHTNLYHTPGTADEVVASLSDQTEAQKILRAQFAYEQGNVNLVYEDVKYFLRAHSGLNAVISAGILLSRCAIWRGDVTLWRRARQHLYEAPCKNDDERKILSFWIAVLDSSVRDIREFPAWFTVGNFDVLPADSYPTARVLYARYLFIWAHDLAVGKIHLQEVDGFGLIRTLPYIIEPMLSQSKIENTLLPRIHLLLILATVYHNLGENGKATAYLDDAIALCLPDKLYNPLLDYRQGLDTLFDDRLLLADENALKTVKEMHRQMHAGWVKLHNTLLERNVSAMLTVREREVAKLAAFGFANQEIATRLHLEVSTVKRIIFSAMNKVGAFKRKELGLYL